MVVMVNSDRTGATSVNLICNLSSESWGNYIHVYIWSDRFGWVHKDSTDAYGSGNYNFNNIGLNDPMAYKCEVQLTTTSSETYLPHDGGSLISWGVCSIAAWSDFPIDPGGDLPDKFYWTPSISKNSKIEVTADEWNRLARKVHEWEDVLGYNSSTIERAVKGNYITVSIYESMARAIREIGGSVSSVNKDLNITADSFNRLVEALEELR